MSEFERRLADLAGEAGGAARLEPAAVLRHRGRRRVMRRRAAGGTLMALLVFTPAAVATSCDGRPNPNPLPPAVSASPSIAPTPAPSQSPAPAQNVGCQLTITPTGTEGGMGHSSTVLLLRNNGSTPCSLHGYPMVIAMDSTGGTVARQTPNGYMGGLMKGNPPIVTLAPGQTASALFETLNANPDGTACKPYATLRVTPPTDNSEPITVTWGLAGCADPQIHPVVPGETGNK